MRKLFLGLIVLALAGASPAFGQEDVLRPNGRPGDPPPSVRKSSTISIGAEAGVAYNLAAASVSGQLDNSVLDVIESGSGLAPVFGILVDIGLTDKAGIQLKLAYEGKDFSNTERYVGECMILNVGLTEMTVDRELEAVSSYIAFAGLFRYNITPHLFLLAGPTLQFSAGDVEATISDEIVSPDECSFDTDGDLIPDGARRISVSTSGDPDNSFRFGLELALGYKIELNRRLFLVPKAAFQFMFTPFSDGLDVIDATRPNLEGTTAASIDDQSLHSLQLTLGILYTL